MTRHRWAASAPSRRRRYDRPPYVDRHHRRPPGARRHRVRLPRQARRPRRRRALLEAPDEPRPDSGTTSPASAGSASTSRGARRLRLRAGGARRRGRGARPRPSPPAPFVPTVIASAVLAAAGDDGTRRPRCCPASPTARHRRRVGLGGDVEVRDGAASRLRRRGPRRRARRRAAGRRRATTSPSSTRGAAASTVDVPDEPRPDPRARRGSRSTAPPATVLPGARRSLVDLARTILVRRGRRHRPGVHRAGRRVRQGARAVRPADRHVPGGQAPLRQHARGHRAGHRGGVGRRPGRRDRRRPVRVHRRRSPPTLAVPGRRPVRQPQHPGARRHRLHVGARRPPLPAAGHRARALLDAEAAAIDVTDLTAPGVAPRANRRPAARGRADPRRGAGVRRARSRTSTRQAQRDRADRDRLRHAALAQAVGSRRRRRSSSSSSSRSSPPPASSARSYGITGWVILTLIQHATEDQVAAVGAGPRSTQEVIWCQLFSEPDAGSDAAGIKTQGDPGRRRLAGQRPEGVDERRPRRRLRPRHRAHQPRRPEARRHHHDGHRHARRGRRGAAAAR